MKESGPQAHWRIYSHLELEVYLFDDRSSTRGPPSGKEGNGFWGLTVANNSDDNRVEGLA